jgi:hypothetical protein
MQIEVLMVANSFFLTLVLVILLAILAKNKGHIHHTSKKVREDISKIKSQINGS